MALLEINNLRKKITKQFEINIPSLNLESNQILCILGRNGAGKTTLSRMICGLLSYDSGVITLDNRIIKNINNLGDLIGYVQQSKGLPEELTVYEYLLHQSRLKKINNDSIEEALLVANLSNLKDTYISHLSEGTKRKLHILASILHKPKLIILDEPTVGIDPIVRIDLIKYISKLCKNGMSAIISTHYLDEAELLGDQIVFMNYGTIIFSSSREKLIKERLKDNYLLLTLLSHTDKSKVEELIVKLKYIKSYVIDGNDILIEQEDASRDYLPTLVDDLTNNNISILSIQRYKEPFEDLFNKYFQKIN